MNEEPGSPPLPLEEAPQNPNERSFAPLGFAAGFIMALVLVGTCIQVMTRQSLFSSIWTLVLFAVLIWFARRKRWRNFGQGLVAGMITGVAVVLLLVAACFALVVGLGR